MEVTRKKIELIMFAMLTGLTIVLLASPVMAETIVYSEGFETTDGGYTHTGSSDQWQWGVPTSGPGSAHSGTKLWATNLAGNVPSPSDSYLTSPAIAVPSLGANQIARVHFSGWIAVDEMYDRGEFQVSKDGVNWVTEGEFLNTMGGGWKEYYFDISKYAGGNVYLRFRLYADYGNAFYVGSYDMSGWYIDDIAITITDPQLIKTTLSLEASEDQSAYASCPWIYTWDGTEYVKDNDVYPTARGQKNEYTDYYKISKPLVAEDNKYLLQLRETDNENSYSDLLQLITVDHPSGVKVSSDEDGNIWTYSNPQSLITAIDNNGNNVLSQLEIEDDTGPKVYNNDNIELDFSNLDTSNGATLVLRALGFKMDSEEGNPTFETPVIYIQTQDSNGNWVTRNEFIPRMDWTTNAYNLKDYLTTSKKIRLYAKSCHEGKYHIIDYVGMDTSPQAQTKLTRLSPASAVHSINGDIKNSIAASDNNYATMTTSEDMSLAFDVPAQAGEVRDFVLVSEGYYVPIGTYFIYTWDGNSWVQRDAWSIDGYGDQTRDFDLSTWLPDPAGEYKVRIWQDYWYEPAGIDYVKLTRDDVVGTPVSAYDFQKSSDVLAQLIASDDNIDYWDWGESLGSRNRWVEVKWTGFATNTPPTTNPVTVTDISSQTPTIGWTYGDVESNPQTQYEVEVWTGAGGTGINVWDPSVGSGAITSLTYAGTSLVGGQTYYVRVRAFDGTSWGGWSEAIWTVPSIPTNNPPVAVVNGPYTGSESSLITFDATGSSDPDDDSLTYEWDLDNDGNFELSSSEPTVTYTWEDDYSGTISLKVTDEKGLSATASTTVTVNNVAPTVTSIGGVISENDIETVSGIINDPSPTDTFEVTINWGDGSTETFPYPSGSTEFSETHQYMDDDPSVTSSDDYTVTITLKDDNMGEGTTSTTVIVNNVAPVIGEINSPVEPIKVGNPITVDSTFTDVGILDTHSAVWDWGDGTLPEEVSVTENGGAGSVSGTHTYSSANIYTVKLTVTDDDLGANYSVSNYIVVFDPEGGFVTGGGWINSPAGAYASNPSLGGTANFGFVSKYKKGATVPTGVTQFNFKVADLNFHSDNYDWLVIAGARAQYKGIGTINGEGEYGFMLTAIDGELDNTGSDKFRIKIWDKASDTIIYDNLKGADDTADPTTKIQGGSITIHKEK